MQSLIKNDFILKIKMFEDYEKETVQFSFALTLLFIFVDEEIYNNPSLHSEEQDELKIPDG